MSVASKSFSYILYFLSFLRLGSFLLNRDSQKVLDRL